MKSHPLAFLAFLFFTTIGFATPPNVVMIISDDQAWTDYSFLGHPHVQTPNIDRLASQSLTFPRAYCPASLCCPSLASIITGKYPHQHRVTSNDPPLPTAGRPPDFAKSPSFAEGREIYNRYMDAEQTIPRLLAAHGYLALQTGKWWQGDFTRGGFTHGMTKGERHGDAGLDIGRKTMDPIYQFIAEAKKAEKPFFVWYAPMLPHTPHNPPKRLLDLFKDKTPSLPIANYWAMIALFDETIGDLLAHLDKQGLTQNTIVLYVTDNGWIQSPNSPNFAPRSKQSPYDGGLRTPLLLRWPEKVSPARNDSPISSLDIYPTLLTACGVKFPAGLPGVNLLDPTALAARKAVYGDCYSHNSKDLAKPSASLRWRYLIEDGWKIIVPYAPNEPGSPELYQLDQDPLELKNLAPAEPDRIKAMTAKLDAWWTPE